MKELVPQVISARAAGEGLRPEPDHRCGRSRPARAVARCDRRGPRRHFTGRLGRLWPCRAGLSEARRRRDRPPRRTGAAAEPAADDPPGQGRVLGHRDQARAGARARRLSGVHAQGDDRSQLRRLCAAAAGAAAAHLPAVRDPQRADGGDHPRTRGHRRLTNSSGCTAWATRCTSNCARIGPSLPAAPMRRSAAIATCSPIWCGGCWRTAPTLRSLPLPRTRVVPIERLLRRPADMIGSPRQGASSEAAVAARPVLAAAAEFARRGVRRATWHWTGCWRDVAAETGKPAAAPLIDGKSARRPAARRRQPDRHGDSCRQRHRSDARAGEPCRVRRESRLSRLERHPAQTDRASTLERAADLLQQRQGRFIALLQREGGKTLDDALSEVREAIDFCRYYAAEGRRLFGSRPAAAGTDRRKQRRCACADAASSSRSRHGIFRWRSSLGKFRRR